MKKSTLIAIAAFGVLMAACHGTGKRPEQKGNSSTSGTCIMACDASFENVMQQEIEVFEYVYPNASILSYYTDEKACIDSLLFGKARVAVVGHELTKDQIEFLRDKKHFAKTKKSRSMPWRSLSIRKIRWKTSRLPTSRRFSPANSPNGATCTLRISENPGSIRPQRLIGSKIHDRQRASWSPLRPQRLFG